MLRRFLAILAAVLLLIAIGYWARLPGVENKPLDPQPSATTSKAPDSGSPPVLDDRVDAPIAPMPDTREARSQEPVAASPSPSKLLVVFGRTIDEHNQPLAGVVARLQSFQIWAAGIDVPRLPGKVDLRGFEVATDAEGTFRFEVPLPTVEVTWLTLEPDPFHDSARVSFGDGRTDSRPVIHVVDSDLGTFRLVSTGAIRGRVSDASGLAIADAQLHTAIEYRSTLGRNATSDALGNYTIGHVPQATLGVAASCEKYLSDFRTPVEVRAGQFTDGVDFVLRAAPTISGMVVDESGTALEGVRLSGRPTSSGTRASATSGADGNFTMSLPQVEPYSLEATLAGFEPYNESPHFDDRSVDYPPGTSGIRIEMKRSMKWPLLVINSETEQPIERFGFDVLRNCSDHAPNRVHRSNPRPRVEQHPGGLAYIAMRPGLDVLVVVTDQRRQQSVDLEGPPADGRIVVRMEVGSAIVGRLLLGGAPAAKVLVRLDSGYVEGDDYDASGHQRGYFQIERSGGRTVATDDEGRFRFAGVEEGFYRIVAQASGGMAIHQAPFDVNAALVDLGDIPLEPGASLLGTVRVPRGRSLTGLAVHLDDQQSGPKQTTDAEGRFQFDGIAAGVHKLQLEEVPGAILDPPSLDVTLAAGERRNVVYDVSSSGTCQVSLTILLGTQPAANTDVELVVPVKGDPDGSWRLDVSGRKADFYRLGRTDAQGRVTGSAPARGVAHIGLRLFGELEHPTLELDLAQDTRIDQTVVFEVGTLVLRIPDDVVLPARGDVRVSLRQGKDRVQVQRLYERIEPGSSSRSWRFESALAGELGVVLELIDRSEKPPISEESTRSGPLFKAMADVVIQPNRVTEVTLH